ncbi:APC family permease [Alicyclobacillaceae bacterium I2511]|nr:APC family permease [Alicyclobacillaceae bacterium I2511]
MLSGVEVWIHPIMTGFAILAIVAAVFNLGNMRRWLIGRPMRTRELSLAHNKLLWFVAMVVLSADLYSSVAYGPEAGMTELAFLGNSAKWMILPITGATVALLGMLIASYIMGVIAYPNGGGAYAIARDNFRHRWIALVAGSSLMIDYILTVAVSVSAGIQAMASAYPVLAPYQVTFSLLSILVILLVNLRGLSEAASIFAWPTLLFMVGMVILIGTGLSHEFHGNFSIHGIPPFGTLPAQLTTLVALKAFSSACSALTGIETISNSVPIFRAGRTGAIKAYLGLGIITGITLMGFAYQLYVENISVNPRDTMLSQLAQLYFGHGILYQGLMWLTFLILVLAANSTFTGFPQLVALIAADGYLPRSLAIRGDRLGYSNGMIILSAVSALLVEAFHAQTNALIPLYAIGVFVAFTIAQAGLTRRWWRLRPTRWRPRLVMNAVGAVVTACVSLIFATTKFTAGAWIVLIVLPLLVWMSLNIRKHYDAIANELRINLNTTHPQPHHVVSIVLISGIHRVVLNTIEFANSLYHGEENDVIAVYIGFDDDAIHRMEQKWEQWGAPCRLVTAKSEYRSLLMPLSRLIRHLETKEGRRPDHIHLIIAQFIPKKWWHYLLHNQTSLLLRTWMIRHQDVVVTTVPYHLHK